MDRYVYLYMAIRSRNLSLTAIRALLKITTRCDVSSFYVIEQALSVAMKRFDRCLVNNEHFAFLQLWIY